ncbi:MAG: hypothetical protein ACLUD2_05550 [Clostridium sp.]
MTKIARYLQEICRHHDKVEVLADQMLLGQMDGYAKEWNINGETEC